MLLHPLGELSVHQRVAPLGMKIQWLGSARPKLGTSRYDVVDFMVGSGDKTPAVVDETLVEVRDDFAPAQYFDMSDDEKLSRPSFEKHRAGVRLPALGMTAGGIQTANLKFENAIVDEILDDSPTPEPLLGLYSDLDLYLLAFKGAAGRSEIRLTGRAKYRVPDMGIGLAEPAFTLTSPDTMDEPAIAGLDPLRGVQTYTEAADLLEAQAALGGSLQVTYTHEAER